MVSKKKPVKAAGYRLSPNAQADLERIWFYGLEQWGVEAADKYYHAFLSHFEYLAEQPLLYPVSSIRDNYRRSVCGRDSVFYRTDGPNIEIMAIIGRQDLHRWV